jgi:hypothetical protein
MKERSHLDLEAPRFAGKPHAWIQWKGTDVCADLYCQCGWQGHHDGDFLYYFQCPACRQVWEMGTHITLYPVTTEELRDRGNPRIVGFLPTDEPIGPRLENP